MSDEIGTAKSEIADARHYAARPLVFAADAEAALAQRDEDQLAASLPLILGGWGTVRDGVLRTSSLVGEVAKSIALFQDANATQISLEHGKLARAVAESACKLRLAAELSKNPDDLGVAEGFVCGGG